MRRYDLIFALVLLALVAGESRSQTVVSVANSTAIKQTALDYWFELAWDAR